MNTTTAYSRIDCCVPGSCKTSKSVSARPTLRDGKGVVRPRGILQRVGGLNAGAIRAAALRGVAARSRTIQKVRARPVIQAAPRVIRQVPRVKTQYVEAVRPAPVQVVRRVIQAPIRQRVVQQRPIVRQRVVVQQPQTQRVVIRRQPVQQVVQRAPQRLQTVRRVVTRPVQRQTVQYVEQPVRYVQARSNRPLRSFGGIQKQRIVDVPRFESFTTQRSVVRKGRGFRGF